ncbi:cysteine-rich venom protein triflin-like [Rana temporaria]|uniref:cysteine-rich venom protein triflin-like n=1 Tax=Rana temporaria TaxID=8407 RepID=UPI001AAD362D|nr:cysteine-rich venom protein triflin-like [Rana temporaria]
MKTILITTLCLLALIAQAAAQATDPSAIRSTKIEANRKECLNAINKCRRNVNPTASNMAEAVWNTEAADLALKYAKLCIKDHSALSTRRLSSGVDCGENLFFATYAASWTEAIDAFCNESKYFVYNKGPVPSDATIGHYTQQAWYSSYMVGADVSYCPSRTDFQFFYVVRMCPPGNIDSSLYKPYTVGTPCAMCPNNCNNGLCTNPCPYNFESPQCSNYKSMCSYPMVNTQCPRTCNCTRGEIV